MASRRVKEEEFPEVNGVDLASLCGLDALVTLAELDSCSVPEQILERYDDVAPEHYSSEEATIQGKNTTTLKKNSEDLPTTTLADWVARGTAATDVVLLPGGMRTGREVSRRIFGAGDWLRRRPLPVVDSCASVVPGKTTQYLSGVNYFATNNTNNSSSTTSTKQYRTIDFGGESAAAEESLCGGEENGGSRAEGSSREDNNFPMRGGIESAPSSDGGEYSSIGCGGEIASTRGREDSNASPTDSTTSSNVSSFLSRTLSRLGVSGFLSRAEKAANDKSIPSPTKNSGGSTAAGSENQGNSSTSEKSSQCKSSADDSSFTSDSREAGGATTSKSSSTKKKASAEKMEKTAGGFGFLPASRRSSRSSDIVNPSRAGSENQILSRKPNLSSDIINCYYATVRSELRKNTSPEKAPRVPVFVYFGAEWCPDCMVVAPQILARCREAIMKTKSHLRKNVSSSSGTVIVSSEVSFDTTAKRTALLSEEGRASLDGSCQVRRVKQPEIMIRASRGPPEGAIISTARRESSSTGELPSEKRSTEDSNSVLEGRNYLPEASRRISTTASSIAGELMKEESADAAGAGSGGSYHVHTKKTWESSSRESGNSNTSAPASTAKKSTTGNKTSRGRSSTSSSSQHNMTTSSQTTSLGGAGGEKKEEYSAPQTSALLTDPFHLVYVSSDRHWDATTRASRQLQVPQMPREMCSEIFCKNDDLCGGPVLLAPSEAIEDRFKKAFGCWGLREERRLFGENDGETTLVGRGGKKTKKTKKTTPRSAEEETSSDSSSEIMSPGDKKIECAENSSEEDNGGWESSESSSENKPRLPGLVGLYGKKDSTERSSRKLYRKKHARRRFPFPSLFMLQMEERRRPVDAMGGSSLRMAVWVPVVRRVPLDEESMAQL